MTQCGKFNMAAFVTFTTHKVRLTLDLSSRMRTVFAPPVSVMELFGNLCALLDYILFTLNYYYTYKSAISAANEVRFNNQNVTGLKTTEALTSSNSIFGRRIMCPTGRMRNLLADQREPETNKTEEGIRILILVVTANFELKKV